MLLHHKILAITTMLYLLLFFFHILFFVLKKEGFLKGISILFYITFSFHLSGFILRWVESYILGIGHAPLTNFYESLIFFALCLVFIPIFDRKNFGSPLLTLFLSLFCLILMAYASSFSPSEKGIRPLIPALRSNWLHIHVLTCFIAYAFFFIGFLSSVFHLFGLNRKPVFKERTLEEISYKSVAIGFPMLTIGILSGSVWAHYAWGSYWSWDPKETWSLITWIIYAIFLHERLRRGLKGRWLALLSLAGFASVIFTYIGVNFVLSGLHSYA